MAYNTRALLLMHIIGWKCSLKSDWSCTLEFEIIHAQVCFCPILLWVSISPAESEKIPEQSEKNSPDQGNTILNQIINLILSLNPIWNLNLILKLKLNMNMNMNENLGLNLNPNPNADICQLG